jgi:cell division protein FtsW (lipid II flippase)
MWMKNLFNIFFFGLTVWFFKSYADSDPKNKVILERTTAGKGMQYILYGFAGWFLLVGFYRYLRFQRRFVQKIIYDTKSDNFILTKRGFFGGSKPI